MRGRRSAIEGEVGNVVCLVCCDGKMYLNEFGGFDRCIVVVVFAAGRSRRRHA